MVARAATSSWRRVRVSAWISADCRRCRELARTQVIDCHVAGDRQEPGLRLPAFRAKRPGGSPNAEKRIVDGVFGGVWISQEGEGDPKRVAPIAQEQLVERRGVTGRHGGDQRRVVAAAGSDVPRNRVSSARAAICDPCSVGRGCWPGNHCRLPPGSVCHDPVLVLVLESSLDRSELPRDGRDAGMNPRKIPRLLLMAFFHVALIRSESRRVVTVGRSETRGRGSRTTVEERCPARRPIVGGLRIAVGYRFRDREAPRRCKPLACGETP